MKLITSNEDKARNFKKILGDKIELIAGEELKEVDGSSEEVIIHKALQSEIDYITEYTTIIIDGKEEVNTKGNIDFLKDQIGKDITCVTYLGYKTVHSIYVYSGKVNGILTKQLLENKNFGSRDTALKNILTKNEDFLLDIEDVDRWDGEYQK